MHPSLLRLADHAAPKYVRHAPPNPPNVTLTAKIISKTLGATAIFWILYRVKKDGLVMLGLKHPWDH
jgi:hypothetical protein